MPSFSLTGTWLANSSNFAESRHWSEPMFYDIVAVEPLPKYRLRVRFDDGTQGELDVQSHISFTGVFEPLLDENEFRKVRVNGEIGTIEWPNGVDLDPVVLYAAISGMTVSEILASTAVR